MEGINEAWGGVFAYNGYENEILFRKFQIVPRRLVSKRCANVVELRGYVKLDADHGRWRQDDFCQVAYLIACEQAPGRPINLLRSSKPGACSQATYLKDAGQSTNYQLSVDLFNFIGRDGVSFGHAGVLILLNAEDQDNYDFVYFRFEKYLNVG